MFLYMGTCTLAESRVPVINLEDGSRLSGDEAPLKRDLDKWLDEHPGYMVDRPPELYMEEEDLSEVSITAGNHQYLVGTSVISANFSIGMIGFKEKKKSF
jgi:hypothetical protein